MQSFHPHAGRGAAIVAFVLTMAGVASGGVDYRMTQMGGDVPSGTEKDLRTTELDKMLLEFNNDFSVDESWVRRSYGLATGGDGADHTQLGDIQHLGHPDFVKLYDRLAHRAVLRVIGFNHYGFVQFPPEQFGRVPAYLPIIDGRVAGIRSSGGGGSGNFVGPPTDDPPPTEPPITAVPEPTTVALLGAAAVILLGARRARTHPGG